RVALLAADKRLSQSPDVNIDRTLVDVGIATPDAVEKLLPRQHTSRALHHELEQPKLSRPEPHLSVAARYAMRGAVELDFSGSEDVSNALGCRSAKDSFYPRHQLGERKRFDDVIIRTGRQPADAV